MAAVVVVDIIVLQAGVIVDMPQHAAGGPHCCRCSTAAVIVRGCCCCCCASTYYRQSSSSPLCLCVLQTGVIVVPLCVAGRCRRHRCSVAHWLAAWVSGSSLSRTVLAAIALPLSCHTGMSGWSSLMLLLVAMVMSHRAGSDCVAVAAIAIMPHWHVQSSCC